MKISVNYLYFNSLGIHINVRTLKFSTLLQPSLNKLNCTLTNGNKLVHELTSDESSQRHLRQSQPPQMPKTTVTAVKAEKRKRIQNLIKIFFISVIFFTLITGGILVALIRNYNIGFCRRQVQETAQVFCSMTEHFPACHRSISTHFTTASRHKWKGPDDIFVLSLQLATEQLSNLSLNSLTKSLIWNSSNKYHHPRSDSAPLEQCTSLIHDSLDRLNSSLAVTTTSATGVLLFSLSMENENLAMEKTEYLMPKINDSVSDLRTCFEVLEQVESVSRRVHSAMVDATMAFDFLQSREDIKYRLQFLNTNSIPDMNFGYLTTILMSLPQYLIFVLVFWFFSRMV